MTRNLYATLCAQCAEVFVDWCDGPDIESLPDEGIGSCGACGRVTEVYAVDGPEGQEAANLPEGVTPAMRGRQLRLRAALDDMATNDGYGEVEEFLAEWWKADEGVGLEPRMKRRCPRCGSQNLAWPRFCRSLGCACHPEGWAERCTDCGNRWMRYERPR